MKTLILSSVAFALCAFAQANAQILDIQFNNQGAVDDYTGAAADPSSTGPTFNQVNGAVTNQTVTFEDASTASLTTTVGDGAYGTTTVGGNNLFKAFYYTGDTTLPTFDVSGLTAQAGDSFTIYLYAQGGNHAGGNFNTLFTLASANGGASGTATANNGGGDSFTAGTEYIALTGTVSATGHVSGTAALGSDSSQADFNGFQLDITPGSTTPEPSSYALLLAGLGALVGVLRLHRRNA